MTRIDIPKYEHEQAAEVNSRRTRLHPKGEMNELMRGQKADRERRKAERQARFFAQPEPGPEDPDIAALRAQAQEDREAADTARRLADNARARAN